LGDEATDDISRGLAESQFSLQAVEQRMSQLPRGPVTRGSPSDQQLAALQRHAAARADLETARLQYTETHPEIRRLRILMDEILSELPDGAESERMTTAELQELRELRAERGRLRARVAAIRAQQELRAESTRDLADQIGDYGRLERALAVERDMLATVLRRSSETLVAAANKTPLVRVLDYAVPPLSPAGSRRLKTLLLTLAVLLALAIGAGVAAEFLDSTVYDAEVVAADVGVPLLGMIPKASFGARGIADPESLVGESYRHLRTTLSFVAAQRQRPPKLRSAARGTGPDAPKVRTLLVSSAVPGEGKTTTAVNLAASFARSGCKTLLIDSDMRRPKVAEMLGIEKTPGLAELLAGDLEPKDAIQSLPDVGFDVIPSGQATNLSFDLLGPPHAEAVLSSLAAEYDTVILDAPVLLSVSDALALAACVDGVLFVSKPGSVSRKAFPRIAEELRQADAHVLGVVFTQVDSKDGYAYPTYLHSPYTGGFAS